MHTHALGGGAPGDPDHACHTCTPPALHHQTAGVHVWFVAHPRQLREWKGQPPNLYDISGSAHFINKADNGIVVHRKPGDPHAETQNQVCARTCGDARPPHLATWLACATAPPPHPLGFRSKSWCARCATRLLGRSETASWSTIA